MVLIDKIKAENKFNNFFRKILIVTIIITSIFSYMPIVSFAEDDEDSSSSNELYPALVPAFADAIISKFVTTNVNGGNNNSSGMITDNSESGDGWDSTTTVDYTNGTTRTYRNYKQGKGSYAHNHYWENEIWSDGCGPTSVAIVLSGYGYDADPGKVVDVMINKFNTDGSYAFENLINPLEDISNGAIKASYKMGYDSSDIQKIRESFNAGKPVIINAPGHFIVLLGEDENGKLKVSDPADKFYAAGDIVPYGRPRTRYFGRICKSGNDNLWIHIYNIR